MSLIHDRAPDDDDGGGSGAPIAAILAVLLVVGLAAGWWLTRESPVRPGEPPARPAAPDAADSGPAEDAVPPAPAAVERTPPARTRAPAPAAPPPPVARTRLKVTSDVEGAYVFVDRRFVGVTPLETGEIEPGTRVINVSAEGYDGASTRVTVADGETTEIRLPLKEVRLAASVDVVHKHRFGSCEGRLTANPREIRYTPTEGDDGFAAPLDALETFTVDYMGKTLSVKPRGARTWNFTTRAENADPLLVFHREVERARERLQETQ
jgi:hypothetical protein